MFFGEKGQIVLESGGRKLSMSVEYFGDEDSQLNVCVC